MSNGHRDVMHTTPHLHTDPPSDAHGIPLAIRASRPFDAPAIARLADEAGMGPLSDRGVTYAAIRDDRLVGFIRILDDDGIFYVNPVVVDAEHRRCGIGRALMDFARARYGAVRFVARGYAVPFYEALGCRPVDWSDIAPLVADDCDECPDRAACRPLPMAYGPTSRIESEAEPGR